MSKHPGIFELVRKDGSTSFLVKYRDASGRQRSKTFRTRRDAVSFQAEQRLERDRGKLTRKPTRQTLDEYWVVWKKQYGEIELARSTLKSYESHWRAHIKPALGHHRIDQLAHRPDLIQTFRADLAREGVGNATITRSLNILQGVFRRAVEWQHVDNNPVRLVSKPSQKRQKFIEPVSPERIERMRRALLNDERRLDATLISVLAYSGMRPGEALALRWRHVKKKTILVEHALSDGELKSTKTGTIRAVELLAPLADDLAEWRGESPYREPDDYVFPRADGMPWRDFDYRNWRRRVATPAAASAGIAKFNPYDLRHSCCSLLLREGRSVVEVAAHMGHSPQMSLSTYAHVIADLDPDDRRPAAELIRHARSTAAEHAADQRRRGEVRDEHAA